MTASLHKITAGDGYTYLTKNVASGDTHRGRQSLGDYYSTRGETPGVWVGNGLKGFELNARVAGPLGLKNTARAGNHVSEAQMLALFGELRHPDASTIGKAAQGKLSNDVEALIDSTKLGRTPPRIANIETSFTKELNAEYKKWREDNDQADIPSEIRASLRSKIGIKTFTDRYQRSPEEGELESWLAKQSRPPRQPIAGYDVTFSAMKSVSVLWALADKDTTDKITRLHDKAVDEALEHVEKTFLYTREGTDGVRQVQTRGLIGTKFMHRDSRAGDPDLHTHVAIANRVQTADGRWLSIDGREIYRWTVELSEYYNTRLIKHLETELGVEFVPVVKRPGRAPVWEINGIPKDLCEKMSRRRAAIEVRQAQLTSEFKKTQGRIPTSSEQAKLGQQATLETRPAKKEPKTFSEQRTLWHKEATHCLGDKQTINDVLAKTINRNGAEKTPRLALTQSAIDDIAASVTESVSNKRATWQLQHVLAQAQRELRAYEIKPVNIDKTARLIAEKVTSNAVNLGSTAPKITGLTRSNGTSIYQRADAELFTTREVLQAETDLLAAASTKNFSGLKSFWVEKTIRKHELEGLKLTLSQSRMVTELATSQRGLQLALAPAGTGKTTSMKVLADAWQSAGGTVIGLSHQALAAENLKEAISDDAVCDTITSLTFQLKQPTPLLPEWAQKVNNHTLIIVDEAGMASTKDLALLTKFANERGASIRLIGDDRQLAAIEAGGILRDIAHEHGAVRLTEVMRFTNPTEGDASIGLREGNKNSLGFYTLHNRIHPVAVTNATEEIFNAWLKDTRNGMNSLMLAAGLDDVTELNVAAQNWLAQENKIDLTRTVALHDGTKAGVGDRIITRQNARKLAITSTSFVKNRHHWKVIDVREDGSLVVQHDDTSRYVRLPSDYVAAHVELGYASTITGAQGLTVDSCHTLIRGRETRALAYVGASRGKESNQLYVAVAGDGDEHEAVFDQSEQLQTAVETLENILEVTGQQKSATTMRNEANDPFIRLQTNIEVLNDAIGQTCLNILGPDTLQNLSVLSDRAAANATQNGTTVQQLSKCEAWPALAGQLAKIAVTGTNPITALQEAIEKRQLAADTKNPSADDAAILYWRLTSKTDEKDEHLIEQIPQVDPKLIVNDQIKQALKDLTQLRETCVSDVEAIRTTAKLWTTNNCPRWAQPLIGTGLVPELAYWRAVCGVPENDLAPLGTTPQIGQSKDKQTWRKQLSKRLADYTNSQRWEKQVPAIITDDPYWPIVALQLTTLAKTHNVLDLEATMLKIKRTALPVDQPASAYWHLLTEKIRTHDQATLNTRIVPIWAKNFISSCPKGMRNQVLSDPAWPQFVDAANQLPEIDQAQIVKLAAKLATDIRPETPEQWLAQAHKNLVTLKEVSFQGKLDQIPEPADLPPEQRHGDVPEAQITDDNEPYSPVFDEDGNQLDTTSTERILELNKAAADYFASNYSAGPAAYIASRFGSDLKDDPRFNIGYAPPGWDNLTRHLQTTMNASNNELVDAGLAKYSSRGTLIDVFRDRVTIAMSDGNKILGFTGRANPADKRAPKYLNTPATKVFTKGNYLYGADQLDPNATPVLCEGPLDAIAITLNGDKNTTGLAQNKTIGIAPGGTALTQAQVAKLSKRFTQNPLLVLATDNDTAGQKAAARDYQLLVTAGADPRGLNLIDAKDPAEAAKANPTLLSAQLETSNLLSPSAIKLIEYQKNEYIRQNLNHGDDNGLDANQLAALQKKAIQLLAPLPQESRQFATQEIAHTLELDQDSQSLEDFTSDVENSAKVWLPPKETSYDWRTLAAKYAGWHEADGYENERSEQSERERLQNEIAHETSSPDIALPGD